MPEEIIAGEPLFDQFPHARVYRPIAVFRLRKGNALLVQFDRNALARIKRRVRDLFPPVAVGSFKLPAVDFYIDAVFRERKFYAITLPRSKTPLDHVGLSREIGRVTVAAKISAVFEHGEFGLKNFI